MKRIYHTWDKWECYPAGFYEDRHPKRPDAKKEQLEREYADFLNDTPRFLRALIGVLANWKNSCEHYLSNENMNRIAWLGQSAACYETGIPSAFRSGFNLLSEQEQNRANEAALKALNFWLASRGELELSINEADSKTEANLY